MRVCGCGGWGVGRDRVRYVMHYKIRLCIVVMFHVWRFEPHTCIVIEGFGALEMHLFIIKMHSSCMPGSVLTHSIQP